MDDLAFKIIYAAATIIAAIVTKYLCPYLKEKVNSNKLDNVENYIRLAIAYAEQIIDARGKGGEKFDLVYELACEWVDKYHVNIDKEQIKILIEGIFKELDGTTVNTYKNTIE